VSAVILHCRNGNIEVCFVYKLRAPAVVITLGTLSIFCWVKEVIVVVVEVGVVTEWVEHLHHMQIILGSDLTPVTT
jgi:ribose/xylose/arabinose/galactoside ABC-type transport system permease subunit